MKQQVTGPYRNREEAGRALAAHLSVYHGYKELLILGLPRGGMPVAFQVALALRAALDVFLVRKLGVPQHRELAMGAIASGGIRVLNRAVTRELGLSTAVIDSTTAQERAELERREKAYRGLRPLQDIKGRAVIVVDDGLATGSTMRAAIAALRQMSPSRIVVAAPVGLRESCEALRREVDEVVCPLMPEPFASVGRWYRDFSPVMDAEIRRLLGQPELELAAG